MFFIPSTTDGDIRKAKSRSTVAVYLNFGAIVFAFLASDLILGLVLGLYHPPLVSRSAMSGNMHGEG